ncbi:sulfite oxidase [Hoeflea poritis]|uniref:Sulfite oxidase n=1 Tax=Hoeflea poritis TaxID=2993659 RepID=A0ABT4VN42_9HYPH|nr:sulfite oxidase [Hoeflea poritis]MDA4846137.1 sulfite oxidase [Hoeflea poritis]
MSDDTGGPRGLHEYFERDPEGADAAFFGRKTNSDRRGFLRGAGLATMGAMVGAAIPFHRNMPAGLVPAAFASDDVLVGKDGLTLLNDRPINAETPPHLLDDPITPTARHFIRNNGHPPEDVGADSWTLTVDGLVDNPMTMTIAELREKFENHTMALTIECGGNGRAAFDPPAKGNQWTLGAVGCSDWTGVRLKDVLDAAGVKDNVVYTAHVGADSHLSGNPDKLPISRGMPIEKAMTDNVLIAWAQNGAPIHPNNGAPLRLVVPGWPGSVSHKWLKRIYLRDIIHDGPKMTGTSYRVPNRPVAPGEKVEKEDFEIIERMPVKSLITAPQTGTASGMKAEVRGHAWSGDRKVTRLDVSIDFGATWQQADLDDPVNDGAWQNWRTTVTFPQAGYYEVWARATDDSGEQQPFALAWNPKGYLNNTMHRVALTVS